MSTLKFYTHGVGATNADPTLAMTIDYRQYVGIGTTSPGCPFVVYGGSNSTYTMSIQAPNTSLDFLVGNRFGTVAGGFTTIDPNGSSPQGLGVWDLFVVNGGCAIGSGYTQTTPPGNGLIVQGNVGIGTTSPVGKLTVAVSGDAENMAVGAWSDKYFCVGQSPSAYSSCVSIGFNNSTNQGWIYSLAPSVAWRALNYGAVSHSFYCQNATAAVTFDSSGRVGIGTTSPSYKLHISAGDSSHTLYGPNNTWVYYLACGSGGSQITSTTAQVTVTNGNLHLDSAASGAAGRGMYLNYYTSDNGQAGGNGSSILSFGPFVHTGSFTVSVGPKSFRIPHPVVPNKDLIHSCIEGPRVDLIYRGTVTLVNGTGTVNMNKNSTTTPDCAMTDGTFEALCTNPQFFLQNMSGFDRVRGTMSGANLVIISENQTSTDVISWMVVAERHDAGMISADLTNEYGYLVTEQYSLPSNPYSSPPPS
jgi:hypothetical protein